MAIRPTMFAADVYAASAVSCTTTAGGVLLLPKDDNRGEAILFNNGANTIFVGPTATLTIVTGLPIAAGASFTVQGQAALFGIVAAATEEMRVFILAVRPSP